MKMIYLILFALAALTSCKKDNSEIGCLSQSTAITTVSASDNATVLALLQKNNIPTNNQIFSNYTSYEASNPGVPDILYQIVTATQVKNGLPLFFENLIYTFTNGATYAINGKQYTSIDLDASSNKKLPELKQLFINEVVTKQGFNASFKDSCLVAQFGYIDANQNTNNTTPNFVKAWEVKPAHSLYPQVYVRDDNGATIYFVCCVLFFDSKPAL
jgi:hypothetical protein